MQEIKMPYRVYKSKYSQYKTVYYSYNARDKTIIVKLPDDVEYVEQQIRYQDIIISKNNIIYHGDYAVIKLPYYSEYQGYTVCVSKRLIKSIGKTITLSICSEHTFTIKKYKKYTSDILDTKNISADMLIKILDVPISVQEEPEVHTPVKLESVQIDIIKELIDD